MLFKTSEFQKITKNIEVGSSKILTCLAKQSINLEHIKLSYKSVTLLATQLKLHQYQKEKYSFCETTAQVIGNEQE